MAIQGVLKTAAVVALFFPLLILAVPALDATFVVAKRIKYGRPVYSADRWHFHHRFANIGFSQRRTVLYLYGWTLSLAALALAMRFVPYSDDDGTLHVGLDARDRRVRAVAVAASVYLVIVLEILKFRRFRERELRRQVETGEIAALSEAEIEHEIEREVETGEFGRGAAAAETGEFEAVAAGLTCCSAARSLDGIGAGEITLAFRRWDRPRARAGGRQRTSSGSWRSTRSSRSAAPTSPPRTPRRAGTLAGRAARRARQARRRRRSGASSCTGQARIRAARCASGPTSRPRSCERLRERLRRLDGASRHGPWTRQTLDLIASHPEVRAEDLAASIGREKLPFKRDVRKLKELGLTESLLVGYRLSPRRRGAGRDAWPPARRAENSGGLLRTAAPPCRRLCVFGDGIAGRIAAQPHRPPAGAHSRDSARARPSGRRRRARRAPRSAAPGRAGRSAASP